MLAEFGWPGLLCRARRGKRTKGQTTGGGGNSTSPLVACPVTPPLKLRKAIKTTPPQRLSGSAATFPLRARMHARKTAIHLTQGSAIGQDRCGMENDLSAAAELAKRFATEAACRDYLIQLRWPDGFGRRGVESISRHGRSRIPRTAPEPPR